MTRAIQMLTIMIALSVFPTAQNNSQNETIDYSSITFEDQSPEGRCHTGTVVNCYGYCRPLWEGRCNPNSPEYDY